jgi:hypothetical protein
VTFLSVVPLDNMIKVRVQDVYTIFCDLTLKDTFVSISTSRKARRFVEDMNFCDGMAISVA